MLLYDNEVVATTIEQVLTLEEVKAHLNVLHNEDDALIGSLIRACVADFQTQSGVQLRTSTRETIWDMFPYHDEELWIPSRPVQSIVSLKYVDTEGNEQTLVANTDYEPVIGGFYAKIAVGPTKSWPVTQAKRKRAVIARYICGYAAGAVPQDAIHAIKILIAHRYENRGDDVKSVGYPAAFHALLGQHSTAAPG